MVKELDKIEIKKIIIESKQLIAVEFFATWCKYCKKLNEELLDFKNSDQYVIFKIDVDKEPDLADEYNIEIYPTVVFIKDNKIIDRISGVLGIEDILEKIEIHI